MLCAEDYIVFKISLQFDLFHLKDLKTFKANSVQNIAFYPDIPEPATFCTLLGGMLYSNVKKKGLFSNMLFPTDLAHQEIRPCSMEKYFQQHFFVKST